MRSIFWVISASPEASRASTFQLISTVWVRLDFRSLPIALAAMLVFCSIEKRSVSPALNFQRKPSAASAPADRADQPPRRDEQERTRTRRSPALPECPSDPHST